MLADLPAPDAGFIGGTKGGIEAVLDEVLGKNPDVYKRQVFLAC